MDCYPRHKLYHVELGNSCAESERQRHSLRHAVQFPVRRRSTATECACDSRFLQDGLADDGCDPGAHRERHALSHANGYGNIHTDTDPDGHCYANSYWYCYADSYRHGNCYPDANTNADGDTNSTAYTYTKGRPVTKGSSHSAAETLTRLIGEKCFVVGCQ